MTDAESRRTPPQAKPWLGLNAFWATVVKVELTDIVFAIDSILVAVAMSPKIWVIITGGLLGIMMMRLVIGKLLALIERYPPLVDGAFVIIFWVGFKLLLEFSPTPRRALRRHLGRRFSTRGTARQPSRDHRKTRPGTCSDR